MKKLIIALTLVVAAVYSTSTINEATNPDKALTFEVQKLPEDIQEENARKIIDRELVPMKTLQGHEDWVKSVAWNPDGKQLASASEGNAIQIRDLQFLIEEESR